MANLPSSARRAVTAALLTGVIGIVGLSGCSSGDTHVQAESVPTTIDIAANPDGGSFRVLTYNVAGLPVEISSGHPDRNLPLISPLLNDYDVVLTQEDYDWWKPGGLASTVDFVNYHGRLRANATHEYQSPQHPGPAAVGVSAKDRPDLQVADGLGVLSNVPAKGDVRVPWASCFGGFNQDDDGKADCLTLKGFQMTTLTLPNGGQVDVYNLNAEAGTNPQDQKLQAADFEQLAAYLAKHSKGRAVIVAGDTNLHLDASDAASGNGQDGRIWAQFLKATGLADACTTSTCAEAGSIDRVAYRSGGKVALRAASQASRADRFVDAKGQPLSDHDPIEVAFDWKPA